MSITNSIKNLLDIQDENITFEKNCVEKGEFGISSFTNTFYEDFEAHQDQLKDYDVAYLLKIFFK